MPLASVAELGAKWNVSFVSFRGSYGCRVHNLSRYTIEFLFSIKDVSRLLEIY